MSTPGATPWGWHEAVALEEFVSGGGVWERPPWVLALEPVQQLAGSPVRPPPPELQDCVGDRLGCSVRGVLGAPGVILEAVDSLGLIAPEPLVPDLPADPVAAAELGDAKVLAGDISDESDACVHD
jgi:hypothetical protein